MGHALIEKRGEGSRIGGGVLRWKGKKLMEVVLCFCRVPFHRAVSGA